MAPRPAIGFVVRPERAPEDLPALARSVEAGGFDELWLWEDCFWAGGIAATATALAATERIRVGLGIVPAPVRNVAFLAMEIAALERMHPGRVLPGIGHGVADWMRQIGAKPRSQLGLLEETVTAVRALLAGETVTVDGDYVRLDGVRLDHPPAAVPPIATGVQRQRSLALSGRVADGTILSEPSSISYVKWALEQIAATRPHRLTVYTWYGPDIATLRPLVAERLLDGGPQAELLGNAGGVDELVESMAAVGSPQACADWVRELGAAGADSVVFVPASPDVDPEAVGRAIVPLL